VRLGRWKDFTAAFWKQRSGIPDGGVIYITGGATLSGALLRCKSERGLYKMPLFQDPLTSSKFSRRKPLALINKILHGPFLKRAIRRRFPSLSYSMIRMRDSVRWGWCKSDAALCRGLELFTPYSTGPVRTIAALAVEAAAQTFPLLVDLLETTGIRTFEGPLPIAAFATSPEAKAAALELKLLLDRHGSDKASRHDYHHLYAAILTDRNAALDLLEIGLGTNYSDIVSHMDSFGTPGASLRAFKEFLPNARIYGADVDRRILFEEPRIKTFFVDQTHPASFDALATAVGSKFDVIIDDGLHAPNANVASLIFACKFLKSGGWFVAEDIRPSALPIWRLIAEILPKDYRSWIISAESALLFTVKKLADTADERRPPAATGSAAPQENEGQHAVVERKMEESGSRRSCGNSVARVS
jgi:SAM-dependent methyltransferase